MQPYQERVVEEKRQLDEKTKRLEAFMGGDIFPTLPKDEQERMKEQRAAMTRYSDILGRRIAAFKPDRAP